MDDDTDKSPQARGAKGGAARAAKLTPEEKALIAKKGAAARWNAITQKSKNNNGLVTARRANPITPGQFQTLPVPSNAPRGWDEPATKPVLVAHKPGAFRYTASEG
jgi:hypothetical protein